MGKKHKHKDERKTAIEVIEDKTEIVSDTVEVWDSDWAPSKLRVIVDSKLLSACKYIQDQIDGKEFSILAKGEFINDGFYIKNDYYVPEQEVETASVDYKENLALKKADGYNTVIHSHPFSESTSFSGADDEHINSHFTCSLLLNKSSKPVDAIVNIPVEGRWLQFKVEDIAEGKEIVVVSAENLAKIHKKEYSISKYSNVQSRLYGGIKSYESILENEDKKWERDYATGKGYNARGYSDYDGTDY